MKIIKEGKLNVLLADENHRLKRKEDIYVSSYINEEGIEIKEHFPYYFKKAYIPQFMTLEDCLQIFEESEV